MLNSAPALALSTAAEMLRVVAHPQRMQIVALLGQMKGKVQHLSVTDIFTNLNLPQAIASQHLIVLKDRGVLQANKVGTKVFYSLAQPTLSKMLVALVPDLKTEAPAAVVEAPAAKGKAGKAPKATAKAAAPVAPAAPKVNKAQDAKAPAASKPAVAPKAETPAPKATPKGKAAPAASKPAVAPKGKAAVKTTATDAVKAAVAAPKVEGKVAAKGKVTPPKALGAKAAPKAAAPKATAHKSYVAPSTAPALADNDDLLTGENEG